MSTLGTIFILYLLMSAMGMIIIRSIKLDEQNPRLQPKTIPIESAQDVVRRIKKFESDPFRRVE